MHPLKGKKQSKEHIAKRVLAMKGKKRKSGGGRPANTAETLWKKVSVLGVKECWPWQGYTNEQGYGRTEINDRSYYAHRVVYCLANPGIVSLTAPKNGTWGLVLHRCNNKICCNPSHLYVGTHKDNMQDRLKPGGDGYRNLPRGKAHWKNRIKET